MFHKSNVFEKILEKLAGISIVINNDLLENKNGKYVKTVRTPIFRRGNLAQIGKEDRIDHMRLQYDMKEILQKHASGKPQLKAAKSLFIHTLEKEMKSFNLQRQDELDELATNHLLGFIMHVFKKYNNKPVLNFKKLLRDFEDHAHDKIFPYFHVTPVFNVKGDFKTTFISDEMHIRKITNDEYSKIVNLQNIPIKDIPYHHKRLEYVLVHKVIPKKPRSVLPDVIKDYESVLNQLKLFTEGNPQFGNIYKLEFDKQYTGKLNFFESGYEKPSSPKTIMLTPRKIKDFVKFYADLSEKCNEMTFLYTSIKRFGMAYHHRSESDKIVDYVISLEALLVLGPGESTQKLSHRVSALYGKTDHEKLWIWEFMKEAYKFRSGILHVGQERSFKVDSQKIELEAVSEKLHTITKTSIHRFSKLLDVYKKQDRIINELDKSMYDRGILSHMKKLWN